MIERAPFVRDGPLLVVAPHPDDESLGCGALLASCWRAGMAAHVVCLTDGGASHMGSRQWPRARLAALRRREMALAVAILGGDPIRDVTFLRHPDAALHLLPPGLLATQLDDLSARLGARVVASPSRADPHCDHVAAAEAADLLHRLRPGLRRLSYAIWSRWHGEPAAEAGTRAHAFDAPELRTAKRRAIAAHASQRGFMIRDDPEGFAMPEGFEAFFADQPEVFHEHRPDPAHAD